MATAIEDYEKEIQVLQARVSCLEHELIDHKVKAGEDGEIVRLVLEIPRNTEVSKAVTIIGNTMSGWLSKAPETFRKHL